MTADRVLLLSDRGPLVAVRFGVGEEHREAFEAMGTPLPESIPMVGLIDTGSDLCVVKQGTFERLGVTPTIRRVVTSMGGSRQERFAYFGEFTFAEAGPVPAAAIAELPANTRFDCILGREVLRFGRLIYDGREGTAQLFIFGVQVPVSPLREDLE